MKLHCRQRWRANSETSGSVGAAEEGESGSARTRAVGRGSGRFTRVKKGICRRGLEGGGGGGVSGRVGKITVTRLQTGYHSKRNQIGTDSSVS